MENNNSRFPSVWFFISLAISSFFLIHLFGFFGVFIAFAYPLWWFFLPNSTLCFFCLHRKIVDPKSQCPVCKRKVDNIYNPPLNSVLINMLTIFFLSVASLSVIFIEVLIFTQGGLNPSVLIYRKRAYFVIPEKNNFQLGKEFYFDLNTSAINTPVNVVQADIIFDKNLLEVKTIDTQKSFATIFTQKDFSNEEGWIRIVGGLPNPGYLGERGHFARIFFLPKTTGVGEISFLKTSSLLANDGHGTNILSKFPTSSISVTNEKQVLGEETTRKGDLFQEIKDYLGLFFRQK